MENKNIFTERFKLNPEEAAKRRAEREARIKEHNERLKARQEARSSQNKQRVTPQDFRNIFKKIDK